MTLETAGFWTLAAALLAASLAVVLTPNLFHAVLWLAAALVATAGIFLLLDAAFLFGVQLLLYAGGVVTIVVFAIMLTERLVGARLRQTSRHLVNGAIIAAAVFVGILLFVGQALLPVERPPFPEDVTRGIGELLLAPYVLAFEVLAVLFLATLLGAMYLARADE